MKYPLQISNNTARFLPWQPSTWPEPDPDPLSFWVDLELIFEETILLEIENVISDAQKCNGGVEHRGHVIALAILCAIDTLSSYAYVKEKDICSVCDRGDSVGPRYKKYIEDFFPDNYKPFATQIYKLFRNSVVHSWNFFEVALTPWSENVELRDGNLCIGLLSLFSALESSVKNFANKFETDPHLQENARSRYENLRQTARS